MHSICILYIQSKDVEKSEICPHVSLAGRASKLEQGLLVVTVGK